LPRTPFALISRLNMHLVSSCSCSNIDMSIYPYAAASWTSCSRFICQTSLVNYTLLQLVQMHASLPPLFSTARNVLFTRWNIINYMRAFCHSSCVFAGSNSIRLSDCFRPSCDGTHALVLGRAVSARWSLATGGAFTEVQLLNLLAADCGTGSRIHCGQWCQLCTQLLWRSQSRYHILYKKYYFL